MSDNLSIANSLDCGYGTYVLDRLTCTRKVFHVTIACILSDEHKQTRTS